MRRTKPMRVGELWNDFLKDAPNIARKIAEAKACDRWPEVAGDAAARCTSSAAVRNGILTVHITSAVIRSELFLRRNTLRDALNASLGTEAIRTIIIK